MVTKEVQCRMKYPERMEDVNGQRDDERSRDELDGTFQIGRRMRQTRVKARR